MASLQSISKKILQTICIFAFILTIIILAGALYIQFFFDEAPCPLCLLQRAAFVNISIALIMNLRYGERVSHWAMVILSACVGIAVSIRQICLHITDPKGFGSAIWGLHLYTWCFIGFSIAIVGSALILLVYSPKSRLKNS